MERKERKKEKIRKARKSKTRRGSKKMKREERHTSVYGRACLPKLCSKFWEARKTRF